MWVVVAGAYPLRSSQIFWLKHRYYTRRSCVYICEESRVGSAPASSSVRKCECKRHLMTRTGCTSSHWSCPWLNFARASTGTWATVDTCKRRTGLGLDWNFFASSNNCYKDGLFTYYFHLSVTHSSVSINFMHNWFVCVGLLHGLRITG